MQSPSPPLFTVPCYLTPGRRLKRILFISFHILVLSLASAGNNSCLNFNKEVCLESQGHTLLIWNKWGLYKEEHELQIGFIKLIGSKLQLSGAEPSKVTSGQSVSVPLGWSCPRWSTPAGSAAALLNLALLQSQSPCISTLQPLPQSQRLSKTSELSQCFQWCGATQVLPHKRTTDAADKAWNSSGGFVYCRVPPYHF